MSTTVEMLEGPSPRRSPADPARLAELCRAWCVDFDFTTKVSNPIALPDVATAIAGGRFVWLDLDAGAGDAARALLGTLGLMREQDLAELFSGDPATQLMRYDDHLHLIASTCRFDSGGALSLERIDVMITERFLITVHRGSQPIIEAVKRDYHGDFVRFAKTPSFLLYEIWDHLTEHYLSVQKRLENRVELLQAELLRSVNDSIFAKVAEIGAALLHFRSVLVPARAVLTELSTRRTQFVSEATQGFLANMVGTIERLLQDVLVDRDSLAQSLNLHMSMISHRTNRAMNRLTVLSTIFLPLSFLCGVYGMNFVHLPELSWPHGYYVFWAVCGTIATVAVVIAKKNDLL